MKQKNTAEYRKGRRSWARGMLLAALLLAMLLPAQGFAADSAAPADFAATESANVTQPANQTEANGQTDPVDPTDPSESPAPSEPTEPAPAPAPAPKYFSVYRVQKEKGKLYCYWFDKNGKQQKQPQKDRYFIVKRDKKKPSDPTDSTIGTAVKKLGSSGTLYYFDKKGKGKKYTGWFKQTGSKYYFKSGVRHKGTKKVKKIWYVFSKRNGKLQRRIGDDIDKKAQSYHSSTRRLIIVKRSEHRVRIYRGSRSHWTRIHKWACTVGKPATPTITGSFTVGTKGLYFNTGKDLRCWYYTQFRGNYLFHSVLYDRSPSPVHIRDGRLGINASHGCIRLTLSHAKWIYDNIPSRTKVVIY